MATSSQRGWQELAPEEVPAAAKMSLAHKRGSTWVLLVEGSSDADALGPHLHPSCATLACGGKEPVQDALEYLYQDEAPAPFMCGLVDTDFDTLRGRRPDQGRPWQERLAKTDWHDLDLELMLGQPVLDRLLTTWLDEIQRRDIEQSLGRGIPAWALQLAADAGAVKRAVQEGGRRRQNYKFKNVNLADHVDADTAQLLRLPFLEQAWNEKNGGRAESRPLPADEAQSAIRRADEIRRNPDHLLANGHDVARLIAHVVRLATGHQMYPSSIERQVRKAISTEEFRRLVAVQNLDAVARRHHRQVLS